MRLGGGVGAKLSEFIAEVAVEAFEMGVKTSELAGHGVGQLIERGVLCGGRGSAQESEHHDERSDLKRDKEKNQDCHFVFPSPKNSTSLTPASCDLNDIELFSSVRESRIQSQRRCVWRKVGGIRALMRF